jgi:hypothetical protein
MKLISLNIWGGKIYEELFKFINRYKEETDIFTFQEVLKYEKNIITNGYYANIFGDLIKALPDFNFYFAPRCKNVDPKEIISFPVEFGQATFIKKGVRIIDQDHIFVYKNFNITKKRSDFDIDIPSLILNSIIEANGKKVLIINFHGLAEYAPKIDNEHRLRQSQLIIDHINYTGLPAIVAGDFNLRMETLSLKLFEDNKMHNLVKDSKAPTTRSALYEEKWRKIDKYADYIFTSAGIKIKNFKVLNDEVSDHLPLFLEFEV